MCYSSSIREPIFNILSIFLFFLLSEADVAAIDVNMGCPKDYSTKVPLGYILILYNNRFIFYTIIGLSKLWIHISF